MDDIFISGTIPASNTVGEPGWGESLVPVWGSGRSAVNHFQQGNYGRGALYSILAITDVFLVRSLVMGGGKLLFRGGSLLLGKESASVLAKFSAEGIKNAPKLSAAKTNDLLLRVSEAEFINLGNRIAPGVQLAEIDGWFVKKIDLSAGWFRKEWGAISMEAQYQALVKLGMDMAPEFFIKDGMLFTRSVGTTGPSLAGSTFWGSFATGSYRMGTLLNDIRPRNMGVTGLIFDPAIDPLMKSFFWSAIWSSVHSHTIHERIILRDQPVK